MNLQEAVEQAEYTLKLSRLNRGPETESVERLIQLAKKCQEIVGHDRHEDDIKSFLYDEIEEEVIR